MNGWTQIGDDDDEWLVLYHNETEILWMHMSQVGQGQCFQHEDIHFSTSDYWKLTGSG